MDKNELKQLQAKYESVFFGKGFRPSSRSIELKVPNPSVEDEVLAIFKQRKLHRTIMLIFLIILTSVTTIAFIALVIIKICLNFFYKVEVISDLVLNIIAVSFFTQLITVIIVITKELWNEKGFLASPIISEMHKENHK